MIIKNLNQLSVINSKEASSKGNQQKWYTDGKWYKADHMGYEGLCEAVISALLSKSNVKNYTSYSLVIIEHNNTKSNGCFSTDFKEADESIITLEHLHRAYTGKSLAKALSEIPRIDERINYTVNFIEKHTNLKNVGDYITMMLELDAFFLNEDRHTNNIAFIRNEKTKEFRFCPYFDFGLSLLSDINDYPEDEDIVKQMRKIQAKPFSDNFDEQLEAANSLYGDKIKFDFVSSDIIDITEKCKEYYNASTIKRVQDILHLQKRKYAYMFKQ